MKEKNVFGSDSLDQKNGFDKNVLGIFLKDFAASAAVLC